MLGKLPLTSLVATVATWLGKMYHQQAKMEGIVELTINSIFDGGMSSGPESDSFLHKELMGREIEIYKEKQIFARNANE